MTTPAATREYSAVCTAVNRNQKNTGWALQTAKRDTMKFPDTFYVRDSEPIAERLEGIKPGDYLTLTLALGNLKEGKTGQYGPWDYWENVADFRVSSEPASKVAPKFITDGGANQDDTAWKNPPPEYQRDTYSQQQDLFRRSKEEMRWTEAVNNATQRILHPAFSGFDTDNLDELVQALAIRYYQFITAGPPKDVPAEPLYPSAEGPADEVAELEATLQSPPDPWAIIRASLEQFNADLKTGARQGRVLLYERDVLPRVVFKYGDNPTLTAAAEAAAAIAQGSMATWPTGARK